MMDRTETSNGIFTIGHSTHNLTRFVGLLQRHTIEILVDVRSMPYSQWQPHFNREQLGEELEKSGIAYIFLGEELGGRSNKKYSEMAQTEMFKSGIQRVKDESQRKNLALMCAEKDPIDCHRALLVARWLVTFGFGVEHILTDGKLESHEDTVARLYVHLGRPENQMCLFESSVEDRDNAIYEEQEIRIRGRSERH